MSTRPLRLFRGSAAGATLIAAASMLATAAAEVSWETDASVGFVGGADFKRRTTVQGVEAVTFQARAVGSFATPDGMLLRLGVAVLRDSFEAPTSTVPIPGKLQSAALVVGADFQVGDSWLFRLEATPGFYTTDDALRGRDFNLPIVFGGSYIYSPDLQFVAGLGLDWNRKYPVLGALGVRWRMNSEWVLNAVLPTPRLEYSPAKALTIYAGADIREETYRVDRDFGRSVGVRRLDSAIVDYTHIRVGAGISWKVTDAVTVQVEGGVVPFYTFDFHRADVRVKSTNLPPYGGIAIKAAF